MTTPTGKHGPRDVLEQSPQIVPRCSIERLRSMLIDAETEAQMQAAEVERLRAELDRLKDALVDEAVAKYVAGREERNQAIRDALHGGDE